MKWNMQSGVLPYSSEKSIHWLVVKQHK